MANFIRAWLPRNVVFANKDAWKALDDATRKVVADCGDKAAADGLAESKSLTDGYLKLLGDWIKGDVRGAYGRAEHLTPR